jgi:hypothetical protein
MAKHLRTSSMSNDKPISKHIWTDDSFVFKDATKRETFQDEEYWDDFDNKVRKAMDDLGEWGSTARMKQLAQAMALTMTNHFMICQALLSVDLDFFGKGYKIKDVAPLFKDHPNELGERFRVACLTGDFHIVLLASKLPKIPYLGLPYANNYAQRSADPYPLRQDKRHYLHTMLTLWDVRAKSHCQLDHI